MNLLLKEYLSSGDCEEAVRCLRELEVPHFHHELVYEAVVLVLEDGREETAVMICNLLRYMAVTTVITQDQLNTVSVVALLLVLVCSSEIHKRRSTEISHISNILGTYIP